MSLPTGPAVRRNIVPLLGIAFVVAVLCTGLFYGVFASRFTTTAQASVPRHRVVVASHDLATGSIIRPEDVKVTELKADVLPKGTIANPADLTGKSLSVAAPEGTPILDAMLNSTGDGEIPAGMRAITIRPGDSSSLLAVLQPGRRIDVQAWTDRDKGPQLRTILENVEVLAAPHNADGTPGNSLTVLVPIQQVDAVALADSAAHVRVAMRNSEDQTVSGANHVTMAAIFNQEPARPVQVAHASALPDLKVSVLGVNEAGLVKLGQTAGTGTPFCVRDLEPNGRWDKSLQETLADHDAVEVTTAELGATHADTVQFGTEKWHIRLRFEAAQNRRVRILPEVVTQNGNVVTLRRTRGDLEAPVNTGGAVLVTGVCTDEDRASLAENTRATGIHVQDLVIVVRSGAPPLSASLPRTH